MPRYRDDDPPYEEEGCEICFRPVDACCCPECPECGEVGDPRCRVDHNLHVVPTEPPAPNLDDYDYDPDFEPDEPPIPDRDRSDEEDWRF